MVKSPDERPFLAAFKLRLASANSMATPHLYNEELLIIHPSQEGWTE